MLFAISNTKNNQDILFPNLKVCAIKHWDELIFVDIVTIEALTNQKTKETKQQAHNQNLNS